MRVFKKPALILFLNTGFLALGLSGCSIVGDEPPRQPTPDFNPTLDVRLTAKQVTVPLFEGPLTDALTYDPEVLSGDATKVASLTDSYLGPIIRVRTGERLRVRLRNDLDEQTIIHWHGMRVPPEMDGHPRFAIEPGEEFAYEFVVRDRAATYWFHPHSHGNTATQVYRGLAGLLLVADDEEDAIGLPAGDCDLPIVIQDRLFDGSNQLVYSHTGMMMDGFLGDTILVNGQPDFQLSVATRAYRLRLLNGSNSRTYKLAWDDSSPLVAIATDGGLLERPVERDYVTLAPGERVDLWADFSKYALGTELTLRSLEFKGADFGMMMGGHGSVTGPANGTPMDIMRVRIDRQEPENAAVPDTLSVASRPLVQDAVNALSPRTFSVSFLMHAMMGGQWGFDGRRFEMNGVREHEVIPFNTVEVWEIRNETSPVVMNHPIHIHGAQFQIIERSVSSTFAQGWNSINQGYVDDGWKDTFLLMPGERAKILIRFEDFTGQYLYHCHNLEHADSGMMRNLRVQ